MKLRTVKPEKDWTGREINPPAPPVKKRIGGPSISYAQAEAEFFARFDNPEASLFWRIGK